MRRVIVIVSVVVLLTLSAAGLAFYQAYRANPGLFRKPQPTATPRPDIRVTIPEGWRREQVATQLARQGICSYADFMAESIGYEGQLFPDTYRFYPETPASDVVRIMNQNFTTKTTGLGVTDDSLILASIVEREAQNDSERALIAGVYQNRLDIGMTMDADPTVQYSLDSLTYDRSSNQEGFSFWKPITQGDYKTVVSPYNTYLNVGLPPQPIANPGLASIKAALAPAQHDYLYFLHVGGVLNPSKTLDEHLSKQTGL